MCQRLATHNPQLKVSHRIHRGHEEKVIVSSVYSLCVGGLRHTSTTLPLIPSLLHCCSVRFSASLLCSMACLMPLMMSSLFFIIPEHYFCKVSIIILFAQIFLPCFFQNSALCRSFSFRPLTTISQIFTETENFCANLDEINPKNRYVAPRKYLLSL